jgi:serine/threonine-protein kinase
VVIGQSPLGGTKAAQGSTVSLTVSQGPGNTAVPSVSGLALAEAIRDVKRQRLTVARVQYETSDSVPKGSVTRTDPVSGTSVAVGTGVTLFVSSGKPDVTVPDVTGQTEAAARTALTRAGFSVSTSTQESSTATPGTVLDESPPAGSSRAPGSTVHLVIATAPTTAKVPDVGGDTGSAAVNSLTAAGFRVTKKTQDVTQQSRDGIVLSQTPAANATAGKGSTVTIVIGRFATTTTTTSKTTTATPTTTSKSTSTTSTTG